MLNTFIHHKEPGECWRHFVTRFFFGLSSKFGILQIIRMIVVQSRKLFFPRLTLAGSWCSSTRLVDTLPLRPSKGWVDHKRSRNIAHGHMSSRYEDKLYQLEWWMMVYSIFPGSKKTRGSGMFSIVQFLFPWYFTQSTPADISDRWRQRLQSLT